MKVISETRRAHLIRYLRFYYMIISCLFSSCGGFFTEAIFYTSYEFYLISLF